MIPTAASRSSRPLMRMGSSAVSATKTSASRAAGKEASLGTVGREPHCGQRRSRLRSRLPQEGQTGSRLIVPGSSSSRLRQEAEGPSTRVRPRCRRRRPPRIPPRAATPGRRRDRENSPVVCFSACPDRHLMGHRTARAECAANRASDPSPRALALEAFSAARRWDSRQPARLSFTTSSRPRTNLSCATEFRVACARASCRRAGPRRLARGPHDTPEWRLQRSSAGGSAVASSRVVGTRICDSLRREAAAAKAPRGVRGERIGS